MSGVPLSLVVAVDRDWGIGRAGTIPWRVPADVRHFKRLTKRVPTAGAQNAVLMGRKTWDSIPQKYRPLAERLNIVLTRNPQIQLPEGVIRADGFDDALERIGRRANGGRVFVIGGGRVYEQALAHPDCRDIFITHLDRAFDCDTRFPRIGSDYSLIATLTQGTSGGIAYRIEHWRRHARTAS